MRQQDIEDAIKLENSTLNYQIRFAPLSGERAPMAFPCDASGHVDMDALSERSRHNYLFARAMMGREFARPVVSLSRGTDQWGRSEFQQEFDK